MSSTIQASELKIGYIIEIEDNPYKVTTLQHVKPGKGGAFVQTTLQGINNDRKLHERFRVEDKVHRVAVKEYKGAFLYKEGNMYIFMNIDLMEEERLEYSDISYAEFLIPAMELSMLYCNEKFLDIKMPKELNVIIKEVGTFRDGNIIVLLDNDYKLEVPNYLKQGEEIIVTIHELEGPKFLRRTKVFSR